MPHAEDRLAALAALLRQRILVLDGAMGTMVQQHKLGEADFRGARFADHPSDLKGNNDLLVLTRPDVIASIHDAYLEAGADIIETNTFSAQRDLPGRLRPRADLLRAERRGARASRARAADRWTDRTPEQPRFVRGALGPTNRTLSLSPDVNDPASAPSPSKPCATPTPSRRAA